MQEAIHSGRRKLWWKAGSQAGMIGMSPRVTSTYFMHDGPEEATECKRFSKGRVSSTDPTPHDAPRVSVRDSEGGLLSSSSALPCIFVEEVLNELPQESRWSARRRTTQVVNSDS